MKELLAVITLLLSGVVAEPPAPYAPSGWRPSGPSFELPQKVSQNQNAAQEYLPPVDPRIPSTQYGVPEEDVSVQGLPVLEQRPVFQASPVNGQQYVGPAFNTDIKNLDENYRQKQYQLQQDQYREFERQRQLEAAQARSRAQSTPLVPRQFVTDAPSTTEASTKADESSTTESTTESDLNEGEVENKDDKDKTTVEVSRQNIQEYPGELFLNALAQLQLQPQFVPFGQIRAPLYFQPIQQEPSQKQVAGFDAATHFAALPSVLAQQQYYQGIPAQGFVNPAFQQQTVVGAQDPGFVQNPQPFIPNQYQPNVQAVQNPQFTNQYQPAQLQNPQFVATQPQNTQSQDDEENDQQNDQERPQFVYQQSYQPQEVVYQAPAPQQAVQYQPQQGFQAQQGFQSQGVIYQAPVPQQAPVNQYQPQEQQNVFLQAPQAQYQPQDPQTFLPQAQLVNYQPLVQQYQNGLVSQYQNGLSQQQIPQQASQPDALQSGLDANQQDNGIEQNNDEETDDNNQDDGATSVAVATAFGARTQPRVFTRYGAPSPLPRSSANPQQAQPAADEQATEDTGAVAEANAFAGRRKSAKLRSRRVRPIFTLDRTGHLVLAQEQN